MYKEPLKGGEGIPDIPTLLGASFASDSICQALIQKSDSVQVQVSLFLIAPLEGAWTSGTAKNHPQAHET